MDTYGQWSIPFIHSLNKSECNLLTLHDVNFAVLCNRERHTHTHHIHNDDDDASSKWMIKRGLHSLLLNGLFRNAFFFHISTYVHICNRYVLCIHVKIFRSTLFHLFYKQISQLLHTHRQSVSKSNRQCTFWCMCRLWKINNNGIELRNSWQKNLFNRLLDCHIGFNSLQLFNIGRNFFFVIYYAFCWL